MSLVLYPRVAPPDRLRVWIGAFQRTSAPALTWRLDANPADPVALRSISTLRPAEGPRAFAGVYEFQGLSPDTKHTIDVSDDTGVSASIETRTLPEAVPMDLDRSFNVLLVSCFHQAEDRAGLAGIVADQLKAFQKPHLTLLMGDQVYLDLPTLSNFPKDVPSLSAKFEQDYVANWRGPQGFSRVLATAPSVSVPDDHEFWNNYPHKSPFIENSFTAEGRENWKTAARTLFEGFQLPYPSRPGEGVVIDVPPVSILTTDMRTFRDEGLRNTLTPEGSQQFQQWVQHVIDEKLFGALVTGQSLFALPPRSLSEKAERVVGDHEMAEYGDYSEIVQGIARIADAGRPVLCITGDVHWGRVCAARDIRRMGRNAIYEIISSPASLVTTIGSDQAKRVIAGVSSLFGRPNPWPRHSDAPDPPPFFAPDVLAQRFTVTPPKSIYSQKGNHVALLSFRRHGAGLDLRIRYWPIHPDRAIGIPVDVRPIDLVPES